MNDVKSKTKIPLAIALSIALVGCSPNNESSNNMTKKENEETSLVEVNSNEKVDEVNNEALAKILPQTLDKDLHYQGMGEFGYGLNIHHVQQIDDVTFLSYKGWFEDGMGGDPEKRAFYIDYLIGKDEIYQQIKNVDTANEKHRDTIVSIIPHQIVLQAPLKKGHSWKQDFLYVPGDFYSLKSISQEPEYLTATHTITDIEDNNGNPIYTVETVVKGVKGYYKETYKEVKKWETGKGLISFEATIPMFDGMPDDENPEEILTFGFGIVEFENE